MVNFLFCTWGGGGGGGEENCEGAFSTFAEALPFFLELLFNCPVSFQSFAKLYFPWNLTVQPCAICQIHKKSLPQHNLSLSWNSSVCGLFSQDFCWCSRIDNLFPSPTLDSSPSPWKCIVMLVSLYFLFDFTRSACGTPCAGRGHEHESCSPEIDSHHQLQIFHTSFLLFRRNSSGLS